MGLLFIQVGAECRTSRSWRAYLMMISVLFVLINLIVDLLYYAVDPRLRTAQCGSAAMSGPADATPGVVPTAGTGALPMQSWPRPRRRRARGPLRASGTGTSPTGSAARLSRSCSALAAAGAAGCGGAVFCRWVAPYNPFDLASLNLMGQRAAAGVVMAEADSRAHLAGHGQPGAGHAVRPDLYGTQHQLRRRRVRSVVFAVVVGIAWSACWPVTPGARLGFAVLMRLADVQFSPSQPS